MLNITQKYGLSQKKECFKAGLIFLILGVPLFWMVSIFLIQLQLESLYIKLSIVYSFLAYLPLILMLKKLANNNPFMYDWMAFFCVCLPLWLFYIIFSVIGSILSLAKPINYFVAGWMLATFIGAFIWRARCIDISNIKRNLLKYYVDKENALYAPKPAVGDIGSLYKETKEHHWVSKARYVLGMLLIYVGPILIGINMSSGVSDNAKLLGLSIFLYLGSMMIGIYMFLLYYTRLKCLYQIQKELGKKLRFY